ncbi:MAG: CRTAC1 family protein [Acidobacteriota bacterium]|nr:CRTAC1 family protein [Acidobacteriota bacterium]
MRTLLALLLLLSCFVPGATTAQAPPPGKPQFRDITAESGITFKHQSAPEKKFIVESMAGGVALLDFDNDGLLDIYFVNSLTVDTANQPKSVRSALYKNLGNGKFVDVAEKAGVAFPGWGMGVCTADYDGDGWEDLYVTGLGGNHLYRNNGNGTFKDVTEEAGVGGGGWSTGCGFADYDRDGNLDLFVSRYVKVELSNLPEFGKGKTCEYHGVAVQCGPRGLPGASDFLFHSDGHGHFQEVGKQAGVDDPNGYFGLGIAWFDYNGDGWPDLYVANDSTPNFLYKNLHNGKFEEVAFPAGVAVSDDGAEQGSMGVALGDYNNDGRFDLFVTNFAEEYNDLYRNDGASGFTDASFRSKTAPPSLPLVGWGTAFFDYDNDGWVDIIAVNGHVYPQMETAQFGGSAGYRQPKLLFRNLGDGTFANVTAEAGPLFTEKRVSRGLAVGDLDNDGAIDIVINDLDGAPQVLHNEGRQGNWITLRLRGKGKNPDAIGAVVRVTAGGKTQSRTVQSGTSYLSQDDMRQHFGLGVQPAIERIEVLWPDGTTSSQQNVKPNQILTISQP